jgi:thiol-disulfide isomerase/thioredoxin
MRDWQAGDELIERPQGTNCLMLAVTALASLLVAAVILALAGSILFPPGFGTARRELPPHPAIGRTPGALELEPLTGTDEPVTLADLSGKVVLVNFWATWCGPCWLEAPHLARLGKKLRDRPDFALLSISCGQTMPEDVDLLRRETNRFLAELELDMPTYVDTRWTTRGAFSELGSVAALPTTFVLDGQGVVRGAWLGFNADMPEQIEQLIHELLQQAEGEREAGPPR